MESLGHDAGSRQHGGRLAFTWTLQHAGWAECRVEDDRGAATAHVSYLTPAPEDLLTAVTRLVQGATAERVRFFAEPDGFRWLFARDGDQVGIRLLHLPQDTGPGAAVAWTSRTSVDALSRAVLRAFDQVAFEHTEDGYRERWRRSFPRRELEALRAARRP